MTKLVLFTDREDVTEKLWRIKAYIGVDTRTADEQGRVLLSDDCLHPNDVQTWIDYIIKDLKKIKGKADRTRWSNHPSLKRRRASDGR